MEEEDIKHIKISVGTIWEELHCPICFNMIAECGMLPCGHNMCYECLEECVGREHVCPCCRAPSTREQIIRNHHFDKLCDIIRIQKEEEEKKYFENLIRGANQNTDTEMQSETQEGHPPPTQQTPIEKAFQDHLKKGLILYQEYFHAQKVDFERAKFNLIQQCQYEINAIRKKFEQDHPEGDPTRLQTAQLIEGRCMSIEKQYKQKEADLGVRFDDSIRMLLASYEAYMKQAIPNPRLLPVHVSVVLLKRGLSFDNVELAPGATIDNIRQTVVSRIRKEHSETIKSWAQQNVTVFVKPHMDTGLIAAAEGSSSAVVREGYDPVLAGGVALSENQPLISHYDIPNGSILYIMGDVYLKSDDPPICYSAVFEKGVNEPVVDYYQCGDCGFSWICDQCAKSCHKGHKCKESEMYYSE